MLQMLKGDMDCYNNNNKLDGANEAASERWREDWDSQDFFFPPEAQKQQRNYQKYEAFLTRRLLKFDFIFACVRLLTQQAGEICDI